MVAGLKKRNLINLNVLKRQKSKQFEICKVMFQFTHEQLSTKSDDYFQEISLSASENQETQTNLSNIIRSDTKLPRHKTQ